MFYNAENRSVRVGDMDMDYISFGKGNDIFIMLPGLGDGLKTVKGLAIPMAASYQMFAAKYKVFVFSRKNALEEGCTTKTMADDQAAAMQALGIKKASVMGVSQGGMIAQRLAIDYPKLVDKLVLAVTAARPNELIQSVVPNWIALAKQSDYKNLMIDTAEKSYSERYLRRYRLLYPILGKVGKPQDFCRFLLQANSCLTHNAYPELDKIACPTLILGGTHDKIVGSDASREMADRIRTSKLFLYEGLGHAAYEEAKDFNEKVLNFLQGGI